MKRPWFRRFFILAAFIFLVPLSSGAYSVLTHEALIDASWAKGIQPLLKLKFPNASNDELKKAHAYAYGGCLLADMGYFPFGSKYFTNLSHYVRSGDFVENLLDESQNINDYAFALGSLCHYMADKYGHAIGTNHAVPLVYPKMGQKFGNVVTYEEDHSSHKKVELSFDVLETAKGNYAAEAYHDFIGFEVARPVLERAFLKTYGQDVNSVFGDLDLAISTYRWSVKSLMPTVTRAAWKMRKDEILKTNPNATSRSFHYKMKRKAYVKEFGSSRTKGNFGEQLVGFLIRILPKIGPLKALTFKEPGPEAEKYFIKSFDTVLVHYNAALTALHSGKLSLPDVDYDTGKLTIPGEYHLADKTYAELLENLEQTKFNNLTKPLKQNILNFYSKADTPKMAKEYREDWKKTYKCLQQLKVANTVVADSLKTAQGVYYKLNEPAVVIKQ